jgi:hypothetical protein
MNILTSVLIDRGAAAIAIERDLQDLRDLAYDEAHEVAANRNIYHADALDNLSRFNEHEPDAETVREHLDPADHGDWRATMVMAATLATVAALEHQVEADLAKIEAAIHEATLAGFEAKKLYATCANGWAAHDSEEDWAYGTLYLWKLFEGEASAAMLRVTLTEGGEAWIDLAWAD